MCLQLGICTAAMNECIACQTLCVSKKAVPNQNQSKSFIFSPANQVAEHLQQLWSGDRSPWEYFCLHQTVTADDTARKISLCRMKNEVTFAADDKKYRKKSMAMKLWLMTVIPYFLLVACLHYTYMSSSYYSKTVTQLTKVWMCLCYA